MSDLDQAIRHVAARTAARWTFVEEDDVAQELHLYAAREGKHFLEHADEAAQLKALHNAARQYTEVQRIEAANFGWTWEDLAWYSPTLIAELLPYAVAEDFDGHAPDGENERHQATGHESGVLLAMVMDVRRALAACPAARYVLSWADPSSSDGRDALGELSDFLGGEFPSAEGYGGRRRRLLKQRD